MSVSLLAWEWGLISGTADMTSMRRTGKSGTHTPPPPAAAKGPMTWVVLLRHELLTRRSGYWHRIILESGPPRRL